MIQFVAIIVDTPHGRDYQAIDHQLDGILTGKVIPPGLYLTITFGAQPRA